MKSEYWFSVNSGSSDGFAVAFSSAKWFMTKADLNNPELTIFYEDETVQTFHPAQFEMGASTKFNLGQAAGLVVVAGLDQDDVDRAVLSYMDGMEAVSIKFPTLKRMTPEANKLLEAFQAGTALQEIR